MQRLRRTLTAKDGALLQRLCLPESSEVKAKMAIVESIIKLLQNTKKLTSFTEHLKDHQTNLTACMPPAGAKEKGAEGQEGKVM
ncbi:unnamed protein product, partial [Chrysoparadoxa australica]